MREGVKSGTVSRVVAKSKSLCAKDVVSLFLPLRTMCVLIVQSEVGYATQVRVNPALIWSSSRKDWSDWSMEPVVSLPAQDEHAPARQE